MACEEVVELELEDADAPVVAAALPPVVAAAEPSEVDDAADFPLDVMVEDASFVWVPGVVLAVKPMYETCQMTNMRI